MLHTTLARLVALDLRLGLAFNRAPGDLGVALFRAAGRLGDGHAWLALVALLGLASGAADAARLLGALVTSGILYRVAKLGTARPRPYAICPDIRRLALPLDRYSFPSGHTLHAVATAVVVDALAPGSGALLWPLAAAIAASRVVLGLHYPSDVAAGAVGGLIIGAAWIA